MHQNAASLVADETQWKYIKAEADGQDFQR
jgi:hypothetical protein